MRGTDKSPLLVAAIGGVCAVLAAVIALFTPVVTRVADRVLVEPTATYTLVPSATPSPSPTATALPTATAFPTATALPTSTTVPTALPTLAVSIDNPATFILINDTTEGRAFYIDGAFATDIDPGQYLIFDAPRGSHLLADCPPDRNPVANATECSAERYSINSSPFDWTLTGDAQANPQVSLFLINIASNSVAVYMDGNLARTLDVNQYYVAEVPPGKHTFQNCPTGVTPHDADTTCTDPKQVDLLAAVEIWKVGD